MIEEMEAMGIILPLSSPVVLVAKKDGSLCFCVDYRKLYSIIKKDVY